MYCVYQYNIKSKHHGYTTYKNYCFAKDISGADGYVTPHGGDGGGVSVYDHHHYGHHVPDGLLGCVTPHGGDGGGDVYDHHYCHDIPDALGFVAPRGGGVFLD
ncbi:hypothetical protein HanRHA438_Chr07g0319611 [Helianthus annuus]|nr:hypothetical protein HanIR_Chr07g0335411 [Helianthus annuus]KAJ0909261.1 hypothetical protein HanRHA438_Chr07g0319611 [Helianthus annuus]